MTITVSSNGTANVTIVDVLEGSWQLLVGQQMNFIGKPIAKGSISRSFSVPTAHKDSYTIHFNALPPPSICIISAVNFGGDVWCMGPRGTNVTPNLINQMASLRLPPGLTVWLYPKYYGNPLDTLVSTDVVDLVSTPYKTNSNFKGIVGAAPEKDEEDY